MSVLPKEAEVLRPWEIESQMAVNQPLWLLGTELGISVRATGTVSN